MKRKVFNYYTLALILKSLYESCMKAWEQQKNGEKVTACGMSDEDIETLCQDILPNMLNPMMSAEVEAMLRHSKEVLDSKDYHEKVVKNCEQMLGILNPQIAKEKAQEQRIGNLEADVSGMKGTLSNIETMLQRALNKKSNGNT